MDNIGSTRTRGTLALRQVICLFLHLRGSRRVCRRAFSSTSTQSRRASSNLCCKSCTQNFIGMHHLHRFVFKPSYPKPYEYLIAIESLRCSSEFRPLTPREPKSVAYP